MQSDQPNSTLEPCVVTAVNRFGMLVAAELIEEGIDPDKLIEAIACWTSQGFEFRIKRVADV